MKNEKIIRLFDTYADDLYRFAVSYVGTKHDAEDIVQDLFLKLISKNIVLGNVYEKSYLLKMTANLCRDYLKSPKNKPAVEYNLLDDISRTPDMFSDDERRIFDELMALDEKYRVPIYLHYYEGYSYHEIAGILRLSVSAVAMRISRGKEELRKGWNDYGKND